MPESYEMQLAERLLGHAEHGDTTIVTKVLNGLSPEERLTVARDMDKLNEAHRKANPNLPDIILVTAANTKGDERLVDMKVEGKTDSGKQTSVNIYDMPVSDTAASVYDILPDTTKLDSDPSSINKGEYDKAVELLTKLEPTQDQAERDATKIVDILLKKGDFGNDFLHKAIEKLLEKYAQQGEQAVQQLVDVINKRLEEQSSELRVRGNYSEEAREARYGGPFLIYYQPRRYTIPSASLSLRRNGSSETEDEVKGTTAVELPNDWYWSTQKSR